MSFNVKHYVAMVLGLAVCATFVLYQPKPSLEPAAFEAQVSEFAPLNSVIAQSELDQPLATAPEQIGTEMLVGELIEQADQVVFGDNDEFEAPALMANDSQADINDTRQSDDAPDVDVPDSTDEFDFDLFAMEEDSEFPIETDVANLELDEADSGEAMKNATDIAAGDQADSSNVSLAHHYQRPNSRWKRNPFMDQAAAEVAPVTEPTPGTDTDSIILEPAQANDVALQNIVTASEPGNDDFTPPATPVERSVLTSRAVPASAAVSEGTVTPKMPVRIQETNSNQFASIAPAQIAIPEAVAQQAVHHIEYGKSLARRGASQAAGQEFLSALKVIAQANDSVAQSNEFSKALAQAVSAMREAKDFVNPNVEAQMIVEVSAITESHRSNIISETQSKTTTPALAMQKYYAFAQQKLDQAGGRNPVTAEVFYCLGKLHTSISVNKSVPNKSDVAKAITFHRAALQADPNNYRSANELGVLMAKTGQLAEATSLFKQSLIANPTPQTWNNLAKTHQRLGEKNLAELANTEFKIAAQSRNAGASTITWMPNTRFNESAPMEFSDNTRVASRTPTPVTPQRVEPKTESNPDNKSFGEKLKDLF